nr:carbohydrate binding domain-containing protein [Nocardioides nematodiphilus]
MPNPSFEVNTTGWTADNGNKGLGNTSGAVSGSTVATYTKNTTAGEGVLWTTANWAVTAGEVYTVSAYVRASTVARECRVSLGAYNSSGTWIGYLTPNTAWDGVANTTTTSWTRLSRTFTIPAGAATVEVDIVWPNCGASETHNVDAVLLEKSATLGAYFDGSTPNAGTTTYAWTGTAHASASTETMAGVTPVAATPEKS